MSYLVTADEAYELAHQFVVEVGTLRPLVEGTALGDIPFAHQVEHVVVPADVALDDFTTAWIDDARTVGILGRGWQVAYHREACIVDTHRRVVGPLTRLDGIAEACCLEGDVPVLDTLLEVLDPLAGRGGVDIVDDGIDRLGETTCSIGLHIARHETIARDVAEVLRHLVVDETRHTVLEVSHTLVADAGLHRRFGQEHDTGVEREGNIATACCGHTGILALISAQSGYLGIDGIGADGVDKGQIGHWRPQIDLRTVGLDQSAELGVLGKERGHLDEHVVGLGIASHYVEPAHDGIDGGLVEQRGDVGLLVEQKLLMIGTQEEHLVGVLFEIDDVALHLFARLHLEALGDGIETRHREEQSPEERLRYLEVPVLFDVTHGEETLMARDLLLEKLGIILFFGIDLGGVGLYGVGR